MYPPAFDPRRIRLLTTRGIAFGFPQNFRGDLHAHGKAKKLAQDCGTVDFRFRKMARSASVDFAPVLQMFFFGEVANAMLKFCRASSVNSKASAKISPILEAES